MRIGNLLRSGARLSVLYALALVVAACGGGGGGGGAPITPSIGNSLPPSTGPGDVENFFPDAQGDSWNYFVTASNPLSGDPANYMDTISVTGTKSINGTPASVFLESNPSGNAVPAESYYYKNAGGVAFLGTNDVTDKVTPALVPFLIGRFPVTPEVVARFTKNGLNFGFDLDFDGINETVNLTVTNSIVGFEPLAIGIGSFTRTVKSNETLSGTVVLSGLKTSIPFTSTTTRWSAAGIGILKTSDSTTVQSITTGDLMEARGYTVNGVAHGFDLPFTVASNLPVNVLPIGDQPALATDGQNFLAASVGAGGLVARLFDAKGVPIGTAVNLDASAGSVSELAAFDGANYWVIYSPYSGVTSGSVIACFAQRISPTGTLLDSAGINLVTVGGPLTSITSTGFAFGNTNGLLAFSAFNNDPLRQQHELYGVLVHPDGTFGPAFAIATDNSTHLNPAVAFDSSNNNFFVTWKQLQTNGAAVGSIYGVRVDAATGAVIDPSPIAISTAPNGQSSPSVAFDGTNYLVVWLDQRNQANPNLGLADIYGARVTSGGVLLDGPSASGGFAINTGGTVARSSPHAAFVGTEYLVTWTFPGSANSGSLGVQAARVSAAGTLPSGANMAITVSGPPSAVTGSQLANAAMAAGAQHGAVVWLDIQNASTVLVGTSLSPF
jgi:hypothetical protein